MTDRDAEPSRTLLSMQALRWRALAEIRQQPGCSGVLDIAINHVTDERAENNWSLCVLSAGAADANTAARAALHVQSVLRRDYDLMTDLTARNRGGVIQIIWMSARPLCDSDENNGQYRHDRPTD
jgi:hypothetical protein